MTFIGIYLKFTLENSQYNDILVISGLGYEIDVEHLNCKYV